MFETFLLAFSLLGTGVLFFYYYGLYIIPQQKFSKLFKGKTALIVPVYNEDPERLADTIQHAKKAKGLNEIIFINDGSTNNVQQILEENNDGSYKIIKLEQNQGKRMAQKAGIEASNPKTEVFVCMDSDTILQENSILELTKPMNDSSIGGVTACILTRNKNTNFLTKCISTLYWSASYVWRHAPSKYGFLQVTNGQLSCYRASIIRDIMPEYITQKFMGKPCTISDDRYLTHHIQLNYGKKVIYAPESIAYTYIPEQIKPAYRMFLRWKRGAVRESMLSAKYFTKKPQLIIDIFANQLISLFQLIVRITVLVAAFFYPMILVYYLASIMLMSLLFAFHMIFTEPKMLPYRISYSILNEIFFSWVFPHSLLTIHEQGGWVTRKTDA